MEYKRKDGKKMIIEFMGESTLRIEMETNSTEDEFLERLQYMVNSAYDGCVSLAIGLGDEEWPYLGIPEEYF